MSRSQSPPLFFTKDMHALYLGDMYYKCSAFLICGGPSLKLANLAALASPGVFLAAVNNAATVIRPQIWISVDHPGRFHSSIWRDPGIAKFLPVCHFRSSLRSRNTCGELVVSDDTPADMPNVIGYRRNEVFVPERWLTEETFNWGSDTGVHDSLGQKGYRSVFLVAIRILYALGFRRIFLVGCDFHMTADGANYAFDEPTNLQTIEHNNALFDVIGRRLELLVPYFDAAGLVIQNCTAGSALKCFESRDLEAALADVLRDSGDPRLTTDMYSTDPYRDHFESDPTAHAAPKHIGVSALTFVNENTIEVLRQEFDAIKPSLKSTFERFIVLFDGRIPETSLSWLHDVAKDGIDIFPVRLNTTNELDAEWSHAITRFSARMIGTPYVLVVPVKKLVGLKEIVISDALLETDLRGIKTAAGFFGDFSVSQDQLQRLNVWAMQQANLQGLASVPAKVTSCQASDDEPIIFAYVPWLRQMLRSVPLELPVDSYCIFWWYYARLRFDRIVTK